MKPYYFDTAVALKSISPTMCAAKWSQVTLYLHNGRGHSCHHPMTHKIPVEGLDKDPSLLHNTPIKIHAREELLKGVRTAECEYCWRLENMNTDAVSDRIIKSASSWSADVMKMVDSKEILNNPSVSPAYVEVMFSSICSFQCVYCGPEISSRIQADSHQNGPYQLAGGRTHANLAHIQDRIPIPVNQPNPYVEAFEKWLPQIYGSLHTLRVTGGEPTMHKEFWKVLDYIAEHPNPNMEFAVNTNFGFDEGVRDKMISALNSIVPMVKKVTVYTSLESMYEQAEWSRYGLDYSRWVSNFTTVDEQLDTNVDMAIMTTVNATCYNTFALFVEQVAILKQKSTRSISVSFNYLRSPVFMDLRFLPRESKEWMVSRTRLTLSKLPQVFNETELTMLNRLLDYVLVDASEEETKKQQHDFYLFVMEVERRRKEPGSFAARFPSLWKVIQP